MKKTQAHFRVWNRYGRETKPSAAQKPGNKIIYSREFLLPPFRSFHIPVLLIKMVAGPCQPTAMSH